MKQNAYIAGVGMTRFGNHINRALRSLTTEAIAMALHDAGIEADQLQAAYMGYATAMEDRAKGYERGEAVLRSMGIDRIPVINIDSACNATAFNQACTLITSEVYDVVLATGAEKMLHQDKLGNFSGYTDSLSVEDIGGFTKARKKPANGGDMTPHINSRSLLIESSAAMALEHMAEYGTTQAHFAAVSAKNAFHGSLNPRAQYREPLSIEAILAAPEIAYPLTLPMCAPISDGAAALVLVSERKARELGLKSPVKVASSVLRSGGDRDADDECSVAETCAIEAYEAAGIGPQDLHCIELNDASASSELIYYEHLGLCDKGEGGRLIENGHTKLGGRIPVNTSGGLLRRGHPIGASGIAQIVELTEQLLGRSGNRQVEGARIALAQNGGYIGSGTTALVISILTRQ